MPVHTIVWAKELYKLLFNPKVEDSMLFEDQAGDEKSTYMDLVTKLRETLEASKESGVDEVNFRHAVKEILIALYNTEIQKQLDMDRFKTAQKVPACIPVDMIRNADSAAPSKKVDYKQTQIFSREECIAEAVACITDAALMINAGATLLPEFDKDDQLAMRLVTCTSNLRSYVFGIEPIQSYYAAKGIAGNIIPAIATTNAIVAGLQILQGFHILQNHIDGKKGELKKACSYTYCLRDKTRKGFYLLPTSLPDPNPKCFVCKNAVLNMSLDTSNWTLEMLLRRIIKKELGFMEPSLTIGSSIIYEEGEDIGEDEYASMVVKKLIDLPAGGVKHGTIIRIEDFTQDLEVDVCVHHNTEWKAKKGEDAPDDEEECFVIGGDKPVAAKVDTETGENGTNEGAEEKKNDDDDDIQVIDEEEAMSKGNDSSKKRFLGDDDIVAVERVSKKAKVDN